MPRELAILCDRVDYDALLDNWRWRVPETMMPLMIGIFGDWVFGAPDGSHWHLDILDASFSQIAHNSDEFNFKKQQDKYRDDWFGANWADIALESGLMPNHNECLGWKIMPIFGGPFSLDNIEVFSLTTYQTITGQLFRQMFERET